jgi:hypothetical protein
MTQGLAAAAQVRPTVRFQAWPSGGADPAEMAAGVRRRNTPSSIGANGWYAKCWDGEGNFVVGGPAVTVTREVNNERLPHSWRIISAPLGSSV